MSEARSFAARSPLLADVPLSGSAAGITAVVRDGLGLATVLARKGAAEALTARVRQRFELELPVKPRRAAASDGAFASDVAFAGTGPGAWLAIAERGGNEFAARLMDDLEGLASVSDQSDGYVLIRLTGGRVRDVLAKLVPIDVDPRAFQVGDVASTVASHMGVTFWRSPDERDASPVFEVVMFRSLARSFWHALVEAGAEYGFVGRVP
jgi:heterotetrameric sarcosine oxidase gamma subunit